MIKEVRLADLYPVMKEMLDSGGTVNFNPHGTSMLPMLHDDGDRVVIKSPDGELKKYDLPLYRRENGAFVLHRVVRQPKNGTYTMCGDNQWTLEPDVKHSQIIGVVIEFERNGKKISVQSPAYKLYTRVWVAIMPLRHIVIGGGRRVKGLIKKILKKPQV
ncbi:MAG: S24/S26 family peptidase [Firmicutes bacterium]|nr:S24/S26 family peptidase [Bacillota bacterium]